MASEITGVSLEDQMSIDITGLQKPDGSSRSPIVLSRNTRGILDRQIRAVNRISRKKNLFPSMPYLFELYNL